MTLDELSVGKCAVITSVGGEGALRLRFLDMGLIPRTKVTMRKIAPMGDPIEIMIRGYELTLRKEDAHKITVENVRDAEMPEQTEGTDRAEKAKKAEKSKRSRRSSKAVGGKEDKEGKER